MKMLKLLRPIDKKFKIASGIGERIIFGKKQMHKGIDFATPVGTKVYAMCDARIVKRGWQNPKNKKQGFGIRLMVKFDYEGRKYLAWYTHLSEIFVSPTLEEIKRGHWIALTGDTGSSTGPHIHIQALDAETRQVCDFEWEDA